MTTPRSNPGHMMTEPAKLTAPATLAAKLDALRAASAAREHLARNSYMDDYALSSCACDDCASK